MKLIDKKENGSKVLFHKDTKCIFKIIEKVLSKIN